MENYPRNMGSNKIKSDSDGGFIDVEINDLIFKEFIKRGYSLEGKTRIWDIADSKLWYLTPEQAQAFLDLEQSEEYQKDVIQKEIDLIEENINEITSDIGKDSLNIIDLGCGDGKKAVLFVKHLLGKTKLRYCPIDISDYMVEKALKNIRKLDIDEAVGFQWNISDFENIENVASLLRRQGQKKNYFLLLGNTLGNFEIHEVLYGISSAMKTGDILLIGNGLNNKNSEEILKAYEDPKINNWLLKMLTQVGLKKEYLKYAVRFRNSRVEEYYVLLKDIEVSFLGKTINFNIGDQIITAVSYKYNKEVFQNYLKMYFKETKLFVSKDGSYALALCKK